MFSKILQATHHDRHEGRKGEGSGHGAPVTKKAKKTVRNEDLNKDWSLRDDEDFKMFHEAPGKTKPGKVCLK